MAGGFSAVSLLSSDNVDDASKNFLRNAPREFISTTSIFSQSFSHTSALNLPNGVTSIKETPGPGGVQSKPKNAGILQVTNSIEYAINQLSLQMEQKQQPMSTDSSHRLSSDDSSSPSSDDSTFSGSTSSTNECSTEITDDDYDDGISAEDKLKTAQEQARWPLCLCFTKSKFLNIHGPSVILPVYTPIVSKGLNAFSRVHASSPGLHSGQITPTEDHHFDSCPHNNFGVLANLLRLHDSPNAGTNYGPSPEYISYPDSLYIRNGSFDDTNSTERSLSQDSGIVKPPKRKWWEKNSSESSPSLSWTDSSTKGSFSNPPGQHPPLRRSRSSGGLTPDIQRLVKLRAQEDARDEMCISVQLVETLSRQRYLLRLCKALMKYGAPTHRLEEYMRMTAKVLEIDGQFLYIPGCMVISFDDAVTHTADVKLVKAAQGVDLGRLFEVHQIYKEVIHDVIEVAEATRKLEEIMKQKPRFNVWFLILMHGCASASVGPFAFGARPIDMPIAFLLGCLLGILQLVLSPRSYLYSNVFEISAAVLTSFLARAFGSIPYQGGRLFCFSALAQSSIALILPGYMVLCGSLELQSRSIVAGSVRMVYSIIYSLFLGFGITVGTSVYGLLDPNATSDYYCPPSPIENPYLQRLPFVIMFTFCLSTISQAKWRQIPVMLLISLCGYLTTYCSTKRFGSNTQVVNALGAFVIGVMGNLYSRLRHGLAAAAILPAIFVQVPSGLAASGSLVSGITSADEINHNTSFYSIINNGTQGFLEAQQNMSLYGSSRMYSGVVFDIGYGMIQVAIGITVGLFLAALVVYPLGKKRSGLFSF
uniref:Threonine/serine exporter-like N-terminal domain-containing protein n=1 Tax=Talaromyces marneffei PM1 TaxID=1077442 RepID=A0A093XVA0_TALMA